MVDSAGGVMPNVKSCPQCSMDIPKDAYVCPYCRKSIKTKPQTWLILALIIIAFVATVISRPVPNKTTDIEDAIKYRSRALVQAQLKAPSTAKFCYENIRKFDFGGADAYEIQGCVDAQNSFGAMIRNNYTIVLLKSGGELSLIDMKMR